MCSTDQLSHVQNSHGFTELIVSSFPKASFYSPLRNSSIFSNQSTKNLSTISGFLGFRQNNRCWSLLLSQQNINNLDTSSTRAQVKPTPHTSKAPTEFAQVICHCKLSISWSFSIQTGHLNSTHAQHLLNTDLLLIC